MSGVIILLLAAVFLIAAISKLRAQDAFRAVLRNLIHERLVNPTALIVPLGELVLAGIFTEWNRATKNAHRHNYLTGHLYGCPRGDVAARA